jgi:hypothetical protein
MRFKSKPQLYAFTTENIGGYFPLLDLQGKSVLTVTSSGDHIINAFMFGANNVTGFDINDLAKDFAELKIRALQNLNFEQFRKFFLRESEEGRDNPNALDYKVYQMLRDSLSEQGAESFDALYARFNQKGDLIRQSDIFNNQYDANTLKLRCNPYLQKEEDYEKTKRALAKRLSLVTCGIEEVSRKLEGMFDVILLSNIADYSQEMFPESRDYLSDFKRQVVEPMISHLNPNGIICPAYVYDAHETEPFRSEVDNPEKRRQRLQVTGADYREARFKSVIDGKEDIAVMLKLNVAGGKNGNKIQTVKRP